MLQPQNGKHQFSATSAADKSLRYVSLLVHTNQNQKGLHSVGIDQLQNLFMSSNIPRHHIDNFAWSRSRNPNNDVHFTRQEGSRTFDMMYSPNMLATFVSLFMPDAHVFCKRSRACFSWCDAESGIVRDSVSEMILWQSTCSSASLRLPYTISHVTCVRRSRVATSSFFSKLILHTSTTQTHMHTEQNNSNTRVYTHKHTHTHTNTYIHTHTRAHTHI